LCRPISDVLKAPDKSDISREETKVKFMNEETQAEVEKVQVHIDMVKEAVALADKLDTLSRVPEFKEVVLDGFMKEEPARLASIITDANLLEDVDQREILGAIKAVGYLGDYFRNIQKRGEQMRAALEQAETYKSDLLNPDGDE